MENRSGIEVQVAVAKVAKYSYSESGDTVEMMERPQGGLSVVLVDGQQSGRGAKEISNLVARKTLALLSEGVRDGAAARAAHDYLFTHRKGKVQATLNIVSVDLVSKTLVLSRNSRCPVIVLHESGIRALDEPSSSVGIYPYTKPVITEIPIRPPLCVVVFTDGVLEAGRRYGDTLDVLSLIGSRWKSCEGDGQLLADALLEAAVSLDRGRPADDISVVVVTVLPSITDGDVRRMKVTFPIPNWLSEPSSEGELGGFIRG